MARLYHKLQPMGVRLINAVHDELVFECISEKKDEVAKIVKEEMESAGKEYLTSIPCIVEVSVGEAWQK